MVHERVTRRAGTVNGDVKATVRQPATAGPNDLTHAMLATDQTGRMRGTVFSLQLKDDAQLRPLAVWHAEEFAAHMDHIREHIRPWVGPSFVTDDVDGARNTLRRYADRQAADSGGLYGIFNHGSLIGGVMFTHFDAAEGMCEVGCWSAPESQGRGLVTDACRVIIDWALKTRGLHRAEWHCRADNNRSITVAKRLGMTLEGVRRESWPYDGLRYDKQIWAVLAHEWKPDRP